MTGPDRQPQDDGFLGRVWRSVFRGPVVPWSNDEHRFVCPCPASSFDIRGEVMSPPAPRALDLHPVRIENGVIKLGTSTTISRTAFDESQVSRP